MSNPVHGLAATIRSSTESETFDLGGLSSTTIEGVIRDAFQEPLDAAGSEMIRITLVVGAGKQARQKYDAGALKSVTSALQSSGFAEDRGASCVLECAGLYKLQHDTGKNLKTVVVFPRLRMEKTSGASASDDTGALEESEDDALLTQDSLESKLAVSTLSVFTNMVQSKCPTWSQKKALLQLMDDTILTKMNECDDLLMNGKRLSVAQQSFYDSCREFTDKRQYLQAQLIAHIDRGDLTLSELTHLIEGNDQKLQELKQQGKSTTKAQERHEKLQQITPVEPAKLKHHAALGKLWKQLAPLHHLDETSGRLLSVQETQLLGKKMELMEQIDELEQASRGWLEDDEVFQARVQASRRQFQSQFGIGSNKKKTAITSKNTKSSSGGCGGGGATISSQTKVRVPVSKWVTPTTTESKQQMAQAKKKARLEKGDVFGAMMATDDSDEDDDDHDNNNNEEETDADDEPEPVHTNNMLAPKTPGTDGGAKSSKNKKKNKKKKGGSTSDKNGDKSSGIDASPVIARSSGSGGTSSRKSKNKIDPTNGSDSVQASTSRSLASVALSIVQDYLLPLLLAFVSWFIGLLFGKRATTTTTTSKGSKKKNKQY